MNLNIMKETSLQSVLEKTRQIAAYTEIIADGVRIDSWHAIRTFVQNGMSKNRFPVGTQITDAWKKDANTEYQAPWDVVHHYANGDMALNWHYAIPDGVPFDQPEAIYYAPAGGLAAGTYHIPIGSSYGNGWTTDKSIQFTLTDAMAEGDQLVVECGTDSANDPTAGRTWRVYAKGNTTVKESGTTSNGTEGTSLGTIGNVNAHRTNGNLNAISRVVYGSGRWKESAIRQYLNSTAAAGAWWTPQNGWDRPPSVATSLRGFLAGYSEDFLSVVQPVDVVTALNTMEGFSDNTETTQDKIFLPSLTQWNITPQYAEDEPWDYYVELAREAGLSGKFAQYGTYEILKKYKVSNTASAVVVWLRSCARGYASYAWYVYSSGYVRNDYACNGLRGCPACIIKKSP